VFDGFEGAKIAVRCPKFGKRETGAQGIVHSTNKRGFNSFEGAKIAVQIIRAIVPPIENVLHCPEH